MRQIMQQIMHQIIHPKINPKMHPKMKLNFYLDYPKHSYYETIVDPTKDTPNGTIVSIFHRLYPPHLHSYSTLKPVFIYVREGTTLDPDKTFAENGIIPGSPDEIPDIRIRLKINILSSSQLVDKMK